MIVVDASFLTDALLRRPEALVTLEEETRGAEHEPLHAPELVELETLNALRRLAMRRDVDDRQAGDAVRALGRTRLTRYPHAPFRRRIWELRDNLTAYDASYVALAEVLEGSVLVTADAGLAKTARKVLGAGAVRVAA